MSVGLLLGDRYELRESLGRGGFGTVWRGHDRRLGRDVAIKLISFDSVPGVDRTELTSRFAREAQAVAALNHPNIVTAHDFGVDGTTAYLVMELISGGSLEDELARRRAAGGAALDERRVLRIAGHICAGLGAAHAAGLVHRDLKPANLMNGSAGQVKIVDFGIAQISDHSKLTRTGMYLGTFRYTSPEQTRQGTVDGRSDLYALGCLMFELLTGASPFDADSPAQWIAVHQGAPPKPLRAYLATPSPAWERLVADLLAKSPDNRPADAAAVAQRLRAMQAGENGRATAGTTGGTTGEVMRPKPTRIDTRPPAPRPPPVVAPRQPTPYGHAGQSGYRLPGPPAPFGYPVPVGYVLPVRPYLPPVPRPRTVTAAGMLCWFLATIMLAYAVVLGAGYKPVSQAWDRAYRHLAGANKSDLSIAFVVVGVLAVAGAIIALVVAGSVRRGSRAGRVAAWVFLLVGGLQCAGVGNLTVLEPAARRLVAPTGARSPSSGTRAVPIDPVRLARANRVFRADLPDWFGVWTYTLGGLGLAAAVAAGVLLLMPSSRSYVRDCAQRLRWLAGRR